MNYVIHKDGNPRDNATHNLEIRNYTPLSRESWLERYGAPLPKGFTLAPCAPVLGCTDRICNGWKVVRDGK